MSENGDSAKTPISEDPLLDALKERKALQEISCKFSTENICALQTWLGFELVQT